MTKSLLLLTLSFVLLFTPNSLLAASFNCAKAATNIEKMICADSGLSDLDDQLGVAYKGALEAANDKEALKKDQRDWIKKRAELNNTSELMGFYQQRIESLHEMMTNDTPAAQQNQPAVPAVPAATSPESKPLEQSVIKTKKEPEPTRITTTEAPEQSVKDNNIRNWFIAAIVLALIIIGIIMHSSNKMNVCVDYTDAAMCLATVVVPIISAFLIGMFNKESPHLATVAFFVLLIGLGFFPAKAAFVYNKSIPLQFLALFCKFATAILYVLGVLAAVACRDEKKKYESERDYQERTRGNAWFVAILLVIVHAIYAFIVSRTVRLSDFTSEIFNFSFSNRHDELMQRAIVGSEADTLD